MKHHIQSALLSILLIKLFTLPFLGFAFMAYRAESNENILGVASDLNKIEEVNVNLNLGSNTEQVYFAIVDNKYLSNEYTVVAHLDDRYKNEIIAQVKKEESVNLYLNLNNESNLKGQPLEIKITVYRYNKS